MMAAACTPSGATATALGSAPGASARPSRSVRAAFGSYAHGWRSPVGGTWTPSATRPSGRKSAEAIDAPGSGGRTRRTSGSARQRVTSALGAPLATKASRKPARRNVRMRPGDVETVAGVRPSSRPPIRTAAPAGLLLTRICWVVALGSAGDAHSGSSDRADAGRTAGPRTSTTPASVRMPRPPTRPTSRAARRTLTGRGRSGPNGPKTRVSERCIAAPGGAEVLEPSIRTDRDTARGRTGHTVGTQRTRAREPADTTPCPAATSYLHPPPLTDTAPALRWRPASGEGDALVGAVANQQPVDELSA